MDLSGISPPVMDWDNSNLPETWEKFLRHVELIFKGPLKSKEEEEKIAYLLIWVGDKGRDVCQSWSLDAEEAKLLKTYYDKFQAHVQPKLNPVFARFRFNNEVQGSDSIDKFVTRLRLRARDCRYGGIEDELIRDRIVFGTNSANVREKLINEGEKLTLDKAIHIAQNFEYCRQQMASMNLVESADRSAVDAVRSHKQISSRKGSRKQPSKTTTKHCGKCGKTHANEQKLCPAYGKECYQCHKLNHFQSMCRSKIVHEIDTADDSLGASGCDQYFSYQGFIDTIETGRVSKFSSHSTDRAFVTLSLGPHKTPVRLKIDTGSEVNIISCKIFEQLKVQFPLEAPDCKLTSYSGDTVKVVGKVNLPCFYKGKTSDTSFYVVNSRAPAIIGMKSSIELGQIKLTYHIDSSQQSGSNLSKQSVMSEYNDLFNGIGSIPGTARLHLKDDAIPVVCSPRRVPEALKSRIKSELDQMEKDGIIVKVDEPTDWVNSIVVVEKPKTGKLRICLDPKGLNEAIRRPHMPMPTLDDATVELAGATCFSILDITHAYWSIKLDRDSSMLTTFATPFCRYRYLRLPFGIKSSGDIFLRKVNEIFEGLPGIKALVDDILIFGHTRAEHDENLQNALRRAREKGIKFNPDKCIIAVTEVPFFGHVITDKGLKPDPAKVEAITQLEIPDSRAKLETFLGMVNYMQKFAPNLSELTAPLRSLLKKEMEFHWDEPQTRAFQQIKNVITNSPVLGYYNPSKELVLETDASQSGIGCCLKQDGKPIAFASKSLTKSEILYAQIEKELLGILFGLKRFHQFTYGRQVICHCDHKPISSIMKKPLTAAPPRLQRMLLQMQKYDIIVKHVPGKEIPVSDCLSRHTVKDTCPNLIDGLDLHVHAVKQHLFVTDRRIEIVKSETIKESQMIKLKQTILEGWPSDRSKCNPLIIEFWNHRDELAVEDDLVFRGQCIVIPKSLRQEMVKKVHTCHLGVTKTVQRAKDSIFWPGMQKQITDFVLQCPTCRTHRDSNAREPMVSTEFPDRPYQKIGTDLFHLDGKDYLLTIDYYSRFFEVDYLPDTRASTIIHKLKVHLSRNGICDILVSDNGPQFSCSEFAEFAKEWNFNHTTSSPFYPQGNSMAEKGVGIAKKIMRKAKDTGQNPYISFLEYRNTPLDCGYSPAQLLFNRRTKSVLPITNKALKPKLVNNNKLRESMVHLKNTQKRGYDKTSKPLKPLNLHDSVRVQFGKIWRPGKVMQIHPNRSYTIQTRDGAMYRRNRRAIIKTNENTFDINPADFNILAHPSNSFPNEPQIVERNQKAPDPLPQNPYITRSGRVVKNNQRYNSAEWTK